MLPMSINGAHGSVLNQLTELNIILLNKSTFQLVTN